MAARILLTLLAVSRCVSAADLEAEARDFLERFDRDATSKMYQFSLASWAYNTNITQENSDKLVGPRNLRFTKTFTLSPFGGLVSGGPLQAEQGEIWSAFYSQASEESRKYPIHQINDPNIKFQLISLQDKGSGALSPEKAAHVSRAQIYLIKQ